MHEAFPELFRLGVGAPTAVTLFGWILKHTLIFVFAAAAHVKLFMRPKMIESSSTKLHFVVLSSIVEAGVFEQHFECLESIKLFRMFVGQQIVLEHFECLEGNKLLNYTSGRQVAGAWYPF